MDQRAENRIENGIEVLREVFCEKTQHDVAVLLQELVFPSITAVRRSISEMLRAVQFDDHSRIVTQQIDFHSATPIKRYRQIDIQLKAPFVSLSVSRRR
jgi:hypothetical protein